MVFLISEIMQRHKKLAAGKHILRLSNEPIALYKQSVLGKYTEN